MVGNAPKITYYLILLPQDPDAIGPIRPLSKLLQLDEEKVEELMRTDTYEVVARFARKPNAEGMKNQLFALGIETVLVSDQDIRGHLFVSAASASKGAGGIAFRDFDDKPLYTPFEDIAGIGLLDIPRKDNTQATVLDLYRKSTNITPRIDVALFDFPSMFSNDSATFENLVREIEDRCLITTDRTFGEKSAKLIELAKNFGSRPVVFEPPADRLSSPYDTRSLIGSSLWSYVLYLKTKVAI